MRDLSVTVCAQPAFIYLFGDGWETLFGTERMDRIVVTREWLDAGVHVSISSDAPSTPLYYPQATLAGAISRYSNKEKTIGADQALTFTEALRRTRSKVHMPDIMKTLRVRSNPENSPIW
jgi:predicted amidohydrolase YtcJ